MKIYFSSSSPYVRKVLVAAHELGLDERIERLPSAAHPINRDATIRRFNPLGQVPTFFTDDGTVLYDSRVICEYLNDLAAGTLWGAGTARWRILTEAAAGDGMLVAALLARYEAVARPTELAWEPWAKAQMSKITDVIGLVESLLPDLASRIDIATITFACGLSYLDFRFPSFDWKSSHPSTAKWYSDFSQRPSMTATQLS